MQTLTTDQPTATQPIPKEGPLTAAQRRGCIRLLRIAQQDDSAAHVNHRKLARYVLLIASTEKPWSARCAVLKAAARAIAPELFE
jgi:hypothetical protein